MINTSYYKYHSNCPEVDKDGGLPNNPTWDKNGTSIAEGKRQLKNNK
jgi:hypothetical protein